MIANECLTQYLNCADRATLQKYTGSFDLKHIFMSSMKTNMPVPFAHSDDELAEELHLLAKLVSRIKEVTSVTS